MKHCMTHCTCPITDNIQSLMYKATLQSCPYFKNQQNEVRNKKGIGAKEKSLCEEGQVIHSFGYTYIWRPFSRFTYLHFVGFATLTSNSEKKSFRDLFPNLFCLLKTIICIDTSYFGTYGKIFFFYLKFIKRYTFTVCNDRILEIVLKSSSEYSLSIYLHIYLSNYLSSMYISFYLKM